MYRTAMKHPQMSSLAERQYEWSCFNACIDSEEAAMGWMQWLRENKLAAVFPPCE